MTIQTRRHNNDAVYIYVFDRKPIKRDRLKCMIDDCATLGHGHGKILLSIKYVWVIA